MFNLFANEAKFNWIEMSLWMLIEDSVSHLFLLATNVRMCDEKLCVEFAITNNGVIKRPVR